MLPIKRRSWTFIIVDAFDREGDIADTLASETHQSQIMPPVVDSSRQAILKDNLDTKKAQLRAFSVCYIFTSYLPSSTIMEVA